MSLPELLKHTLSPEEVQFVTENQKITILPSYSMNSVELITDKLPKIKAAQRIEVPIWLAVVLKKQDKCRMVPPEWLSLKQLQEYYQHEVATAGEFSELPGNWLEMAKVFFEHAADDLRDEAHRLKTLVQDLQEVRQIKIKKGLALVNESHLQLDNLSRMEINEIRPFVVEVMGRLQSLADAARPVIDGGDDDDETLPSDQD